MRNAEPAPTRKRGTRVADLRLPPYWPASVLAALLLARRRESRELAEAVRSADALAQVIGERWKVSDEREQQLLDLQARVVTLTWVLVALTLAVLGVTVWAILRG
jgi:hypothetical protein